MTGAALRLSTSDCTKHCQPLQSPARTGSLSSEHETQVVASPGCTIGRGAVRSAGRPLAAPLPRTRVRPSPISRPQNSHEGTTMKRMLRGAAIGLAVAMSAQAAQAQSNLSLGLGGGAVIPTRSMADIRQTG